MTIEEARERVSRGAAWLDKTYPHWVEKIDLGVLDLSDKCFCVLGQLEGCYWDACRKAGWLELNSYRIRPENKPYEYGFGGYGIEPNWEGISARGHVFYRTLQDAWVELITDRSAPVVTWTPRDRVRVPS